MKNINFLVSGVGGQGTVVASDILAAVGMEAGYEAKKSDVLGLAMRGGSVTSHIRWSQGTVHAPMVGLGEINYMVAFELLEALRRLPFMNPEGTIIVNTQQLPPVSVTSGQTNYPSQTEIITTLKKHVKTVYEIDALSTALKLKNSKTVNVVIMGAASALFDIPTDIWEKVIAGTVRPKHVELNIAAFREGRKLMEVG
ncbi:MAG: indolepyruvate oxidoreductase subunit beta [Veillonellales bacterium]